MDVPSLEGQRAFYGEVLGTPMIAFSAQPTLADAEFGAGHLLQVIVVGVPKRQLDLPGHPYVIRGVG